MNKGYLSKKSWHTGSLRHIEKVWKAEQKAAEEAKRIAELKKELEEERELEQLRTIHKQTTGLSAYVVRICLLDLANSPFVSCSGERLDWMYQDPMVASGPSADEYLLGKAFKEKPEEREIVQVRFPDIC